MAGPVSCLARQSQLHYPDADKLRYACLLLGARHGAAGPVAAPLRRQRAELRECEGAQQHRLPEGACLRAQMQRITRQKAIERHPSNEFMAVHSSGARCCYSLSCRHDRQCWHMSAAVRNGRKTNEGLVTVQQLTNRLLLRQSMRPANLALQVPGPHSHHVARLLRLWQPIERVKHCAPGIAMCI